RFSRDWSSDVCSSDLDERERAVLPRDRRRRRDLVAARLAERPDLDEAHPAGEIAAALARPFERLLVAFAATEDGHGSPRGEDVADRKSTRLNSSHVKI